MTGGGVSAKPKCPDCGDPMEASGGPKELIGWTIPFTKIEIRVWDCANQEYICLFCATEKAHEQGRTAYECGAEAGYLEGFDDGRRARDR